METYEFLEFVRKRFGEKYDNFEAFLNDNPGAMEALIKWVNKSAGASE